MKILINDEFLFDNVKLADTFFLKLTGIIGKKYPVLLKNTNSIHTFFLKKHIDAIFMDKNGFILKIYRDIPPFSIIMPIKKCKYILEFCHEETYNVKINIGDKVEFLK